MVWGGVASAVGALGSSVIGGLFGAAGQSSANAMTREGLRLQNKYNRQMQRRSFNYNKRLQAKSFDFNKHMYKRRYQLTMEDMRRSGLNPILAYQQGASTPAGVGAPSVGAPTAGTGTYGNELGPLGESIGRGVSSAIQAARASAEIKRRNKELGLLDAQIQNVKEDSKSKKVQQKVGEAEIGYKTWQGLLANSQMNLNSAQEMRQQSEVALTKMNELIAAERLHQAKALAAGAVTEQQIMETAFGKFLKWVDVTGRAVNPFASTARDAAIGSYYGGKAK